MVATIDKLMATYARENYETESFRRVLEDHLTYFKETQGTTTSVVSAHLLVVYQHDWLGLLRELQVPPDLHWLTIRMNGGNSYTDTPTEGFDMLIPDRGEVDKLMKVHSTRKRLTN